MFRAVLRGLGPRDRYQTLRNHGRIHLGGFSGPGDDSGSISDHFRRSRAYLRLEHCDIATIEISETSTLCVEPRQMSVLATEEMSAVETGQMSSVATGQMFCC